MDMTGMKIPDLEWMSAVGRIKDEPDRPEDMNEHWYDRELFRHQLWIHCKKDAKERTIYSDDRKVRIPWYEQPSTFTDWEERLGIHDPGVVDPLPRP